MGNLEPSIPPYLSSRFGRAEPAGEFDRPRVGRAREIGWRQVYRSAAAPDGRPETRQGTAWGF